MSNFQELTEAAAGRDPNASSSAFLSLMRLVVTDPASHLHPALAVFRQHLDSKRIPTSLQGSRTMTPSQMDSERALHSMKGIALAGTLHREDAAIIESLCQIWPNTWAWLRFFHTSCIDEERSPIQKRVSVFGVVCGVHKVFSGHERLRATAEATRGYLEMITQQWTLQIRVHEFSSSPLIYPPASVLTAYTNIPGSVSPAATMRVIAALGGNPDDVARLTLEHLSVTAEQTRSLPILALSTGADIDLMSNFRTSNPVRYALLSRHSVRAVTNVLLSLSMVPPSNDSREPAAFCIASCSHYLGFALESSNALPLIVEALDAQLLPALLRCGNWIPHMNPALVKHLLLPLTNILPKYLLYVSILKVVARSLRRVRSTGVEGKMPAQGQLWDAWTRFKTLAEERLALQLQSSDAYDKHQICHMNTCRKVDSNDAFIVCQGCNEVWYCSEACQDAGRSIHLGSCRELQAWRKDGKTSPMSSRDFQFAGRVAQYELSNRWNEITLSWRAQRPRVPVVELDFTVFPVKMTVGSATTLRPVDYEMDREERSAWDTIVGRAERENMAISRYCIPEGEYQKVGLKLLPPAAR